MHTDGWRNTEGHGAVWGTTATARRCLRCQYYRTCSSLDHHQSRRHVLQCAPGISNKHIVTAPCCNHRLHTLNQENATVQQNPYFKRWNSVYEIPESSNVQDLHRHYDYQQFGKPFVEQVPMSIGANIVGRDHDESHDGMLMLTSSPGLGRSYMFRGAPSGGLQHQQRREMSNWSNSALQMGPPTQLTISSDRRQTSAITGAPSSGLQQLRNMFSWRNRSMQTPPQAYLHFAGAPGCSSIGSGDISVELLRQTQLYYYARGRASVTTGSTSSGLQQHRIRNMYDSSNLSLQMPPRQAQFDISSGSRNLEDTTNYMVNQRKRRNLLTSMGASPYNVVHPDDIRPAKRPWSSWLPQNYSAGSWRRNTRDMESNHYTFNSATAQTFDQINNSAMAAIVIEKISHDLLNDNVNKEPTGAVEEAMVMSTVNSLSSLIQQDLTPTLAGSSEASDSTAISIASPVNVPAEAEITQGLGAGPDAGSTGGSCSPDRGGNDDNSMLPSKIIVDGIPSEKEQVGEIEMDMEYLEELLRFCP